MYIETVKSTRWHDYQLLNNPWTKQQKPVDLHTKITYTANIKSQFFHTLTRWSTLPSLQIN